MFEQVTGQELGVVDDEDETFSLAVELTGVGDGGFFEGGAGAFVGEFEGLAEQGKEAVPTVDGAVDGDEVPLFLR